VNRERRVKVALIGAGSWGLQHARIFAERPDVNFCAVVGRTPEKTKARAEKFGTNYYLDIQEMLDGEQPDLVSLCLPNLDHFEPTLQVIEAGFPLLVEKPLVFDLKEARTLLDEAAKRDLFFAINFNHRYARPMQMAQEAIRERHLGEMVFATWRFGGEGSSDHHPYANLIETQCHGFDTLEYLCGPISSVMAEMTDKTGSGYGTLVLALRFVDGAVGSLMGSYDSSYAFKQTHTLEINGTRGRVLVEDTVRRFTFQAVGDETARVWQAGYFNDYDRDFHRTFDRHVDEILSAFKQEREPPVHARAGYRALELAHAAIRSFETAERVTVGQAPC
jgi:myo-inositol 2-dehydrogenase / D-chiro-inositol 1-dehydrogenase